jgi:hypothetical protein
VAVSRRQRGNGQTSGKENHPTAAIRLRQGRPARVNHCFRINRLISSRHRQCRTPILRGSEPSSRQSAAGRRLGWALKRGSPMRTIRGTPTVTDGRRAAATALLGNYMAGSVRLRIRRRWVTRGDFIERLWWGDISIFARPRFCHSLIRQKPETILHSLGPSFYVGNNDTHPLKVVGGLWRTK